MTMTSDEQVLTDRCLSLEAELDRGGWDQPARLYVVTGSPDNLRLALPRLILDHPYDSIKEFFDRGDRVADDAFGLLLATEGWRHLTFKELMEVKPAAREAFEEVRAARSDMTDEELMEFAENSWFQTMRRVPRVSQLPPEMRVEVRNVFIVLTDGRSVGVMRDRGKDAVAMNVQTKEQTLMARVPEAMYSLLTGVWSETD